MRLSIVVYRRTRQDPDNAYASVKNLLDALVKEGWLEDDSPQLLSLRVSELEEPRKIEQRTELFWKPVSPNGSGNGREKELTSMTTQERRELWEEVSKRVVVCQSCSPWASPRVGVST